MSPWFIARATGIVAYIGFSLSMIFGLMLTSKYLGRKMGRALTIGHEALAIGAFLMTVLHGWAIFNDDFFAFTWRSVLIPGMSPYAPVAVALGIVGAWLALVITISFYVRKRIGPRTWRRLHYATFLVFALMTAHGISAGTDSNHPAIAAMYVASTSIVVLLTLYRMVEMIARLEQRKHKQKRPHMRRPQGHAHLEAVEGEGA